MSEGPGSLARPQARGASRGEAASPSLAPAWILRADTCGPVLQAAQPLVEATNLPSPVGTSAGQCTPGQTRSGHLWPVMAGTPCSAPPESQSSPTCQPSPSREGVTAPWPTTAWPSRGHCRAPLSAQTQGWPACAHGHRTPSGERRRSGGPSPGWLLPSPQHPPTLGCKSPWHKAGAKRVGCAGRLDPRGGEGTAAHRLGGQDAQGLGQAPVHLLSRALQPRATAGHRQRIPWGGVGSEKVEPSQREAWRGRRAAGTREQGGRVRTLVFPQEVAHVAGGVAWRQEAAHVDSPKLRQRGRRACEAAAGAPSPPLSGARSPAAPRRASACGSARRCARLRPARPALATDAPALRCPARGPCGRAGARSGQVGMGLGDALAPRPAPTSLTSGGGWSARWSVIPPPGPRSPAAERDGS